VAGYDAHAWFEFGVAVVGAATALSGLLFVAMSINLERIMALPTLPARAGASLVLFALPLLVGILLLVPDQASEALGAELLATGLVCLSAVLWLNRPSRRVAEESKAVWLLAATSLAPPSPRSPPSEE
jgi:modulator of FtsH protease